MNPMKIANLILVCLVVDNLPTAQSLSFDYVIAGGGTTGLALANRLSENPNVTVAVIEAGDRQQANPNVTNPGAFTLAFNTPIDWAYQSVPQTFGNKTVPYHAGKALGGTSTINGSDYNYSEIEDIRLTNYRYDLHPRRKSSNRRLGSCR